MSIDTHLNIELRDDYQARKEKNIFELIVENYDRTRRMLKLIYEDGRKGMEKHFFDLLYFLTFLILLNLLG